MQQIYPFQSKRPDYPIITPKRRAEMIARKRRIQALKSKSVQQTKQK